MDLVLKADVFAEAAHAAVGQLRKYLPNAVTMIKSFD